MAQSRSLKDDPVSKDNRRGGLMLGLFVAALVVIVAWVLVAINQRDSQTNNGQGRAAIQKTVADPADTKGNFDPNQPSTGDTQGNAAQTRNGAARNGAGDQGTATLGTTDTPAASR